MDMSLQLRKSASNFVVWSATLFRLPAKTLQVGEGWELRQQRGTSSEDGVVQFANGGRPFSEQPLLALRADAGVDALSLRTSVDCELQFPSEGLDRRFYRRRFGWGRPHPDREA